jgi:Flp pilus assembly protein TadB
VPVGISRGVGYTWLWRAFLFLACRFDRRLPTLSWREVVAEQNAARRRLSEQDTRAERRQTALRRASSWFYLVAAVVLAALGHWWLVLLLAGSWVVGLVYIVSQVLAAYRRAGREQK